MRANLYLMALKRRQNKPLESKIDRAAYPTISHVDHSVLHITYSALLLLCDDRKSMSIARGPGMIEMGHVVKLHPNSEARIMESNR